MEKDLNKMKLSELHELKIIVSELISSISNKFNLYNTNGFIGNMENLSEDDKEELLTNIKNEDLLFRINSLIKKKVSKYYD